MKRIFILADNQYITRTGVQSLLKELALADTIVEASSRMELIKKLAAYPDAVVLLDYTLFDISLSQMLNMKQRYPQSLCLLFSDELSGYFIRQVLQSGQQFGIVMKTDTKPDMVAALSQAVNGEIYLCDMALQILHEAVPPLPAYSKLTASERLVLHEIAIGKTTKEIACEQNLSFHTINTHRKNIFRKLEINNLHEATKYAFRAGIIDMTEYYI
ncbi:MAG: response regulator transcription factor [Prevotellaceae bacterium]|jgi:DNA-binding NarL/FixJ family response regulator|nr:response regulator transcription factor [Prevotellaceae bacterium]